MRHLKIKSCSCLYRKWNHTCQEDFRLFNEERESFEIGWKNLTLKKVNTTIEQTFQYQSANQLDSYTIIGDHGKYPGDGYVYEFRGRLSDLQSNLTMLNHLQWIDRQTRAIVIQLNLYNPNVQLLTSVILLTEFLSTGGLQTTIRIEPIDFYVMSTLQMIFLIIYMILILYFMFIEIQVFFQLKRKYFEQIWFVICSWMSVALYIYRCQECSRISQLFAKTNGYVYINFQYLTYLNSILTLMYVFPCFSSTIKMIRLFRFNSRINLSISTLEISIKELLGFALMFSIIFVAYTYYKYYVTEFHQHSKIEIF